MLLEVLFGTDNVPLGKQRRARITRQNRAAAPVAKVTVLSKQSWSNCWSLLLACLSGGLAWSFFRAPWQTLILANTEALTFNSIFHGAHLMHCQIFLIELMPQTPPLYPVPSIAQGVYL